jgi:hypothetical protein
MEKEFVPYKEAVALKSLGFDEPCLGSKRTDDVPFEISSSLLPRNSIGQSLTVKYVAIPLFQQAFEFFRTKYKLRSFVDTYAQDKENDFVSFYTIKSGNGYDKEPFFSGTFKTYYNAQLACLKKLIELAKQ